MGFPPATVSEVTPSAHHQAEQRPRKGRNVVVVLETLGTGESQEDADAAFAEQNLRVLFVDPEQAFAADTGELFTGTEFIRPSAVLQLSDSTTGRTMANMLAAAGVPVSNPPIASELARNKAQVSAILHDRGIACARTIAVSRRTNAALVASAFPTFPKWPIIYKPLDEHCGIGVRPLYTVEELEEALQHLRHDEGALLQECMPNAMTRKLRITVIGGLARFAVTRASPNGGFGTNDFTDNPGESHQMTAAEKRVAELSVAAIGLVHGGVDVDPNPPEHLNGPAAIIEVNSAFSILKPSAVNGDDIWGELAIYFRELIDRGVDDAPHLGDQLIAVTTPSHLERTIATLRGNAPLKKDLSDNRKDLLDDPALHISESTTDSDLKVGSGLMV